MSSFSVPRLSSGFDFDVSSFTSGIAQIAAGAASVPALIASHLAGPMRAGADEIGEHAERAGHSIGEGMHHGTLAAQAAMQLFPPLLIELIENPVLGAVALIKEAFSKAFEFIKEGFAEVGSKSLNTGLEANKAGVSVEFFSKLSEAARTVNVSQEQLGTAFKMLQKNAVDAVGGNEQAAKSFADLGISVQFLKQHLDDNEGLWEKVKDRMDSLATPAERARRAMEVMGKQGSDIVPLLQLSDDKLKELGDTAERLGVVESEGSAEFGRKWKEMTVQIDQAWEGMKRRLLEPVMEILAENWKSSILPVLVELADGVGKMIPDAMEAMKDAFLAIVPIIQLVLSTFEALADAADIIDDISGADANRTRYGDVVRKSEDLFEKASVSLENVHFHIDPDKASQQVAEKVKPLIEAAFDENGRRMQTNAAHMKVAKGTRGGR